MVFIFICSGSYDVSLECNLFSSGVANLFKIQVSNSILHIRLVICCTDTILNNNFRLYIICVLIYWHGSSV